MARWSQPPGVSGLETATGLQIVCLCEGGLQEKPGSRHPARRPSSHKGQEVERVLGKAEDAEASDPWGNGKIGREENFGVLCRENKQRRMQESVGVFILPESLTFGAVTRNERDVRHSGFRREVNVASNMSKALMKAAVDTETNMVGTSRVGPLTVFQTLCQVWR